MRKVVTATDSVNECDCCGKTGLKKTFLVTDENGSEFYYGSTCVTRNLGIDNKEVTKQVNESKIQRTKDAYAEFNSTDFVQQFNKDLNSDYEFMDDFYLNVIEPTSEKVRLFREEIKTKYKLKTF